MTEQPIDPEITSDDKLWALLSYLLAPLVSIIMLVLEDKKDRPFIKFHAVQSTVLGAIEMILSILIGWTVVGLCVPALLWVAMVYWGIQAYNGQYVEVPFVTDFIKKQGWI
jgi:uncharacterized membrane protein